MKISGLMARLAKIKGEHGDLVVTQYQWNDSKCPQRVQGVEVVEVKPNHYRGKVVETYILVKRLKNGGYGGGSMFTEPYQREVARRPTVKVLHIYYDRA